MPVANNGANTVIVCPGDYPEQVTITKNITITGALRDGTDPESENGNSAYARLIVPTDSNGVKGLKAVPFGNAGGYIAAQIVAQSIADVNIINLTLDGHDGGCPVDPTGAAVRSGGVAFYNVGVYGTGLEGNVNNSAILGQIGRRSDGSPCPNTDGQGEGVIISNSWVTIDSNSIHDIDLSPIRQKGGITRITNNTLSRAWYGIWLTDVGETWDPHNTGSTVASNHIEAFTGAGVHIDASSNVRVADNIIVNSFGAGIWLSHGSSMNDVVWNRVNDAWYGIYMGGGGPSGGQANNNVQYNTIVHSFSTAIVDAYSHGGNEVTYNTINDAATGVFYYSNDGDNFLPQTFYNTPVLVKTGPALP